MGVLEVLSFLEDTFSVNPTDDEVTEANLGTPRAITTFVMAKRAAAQGA
jgi:acyl carrier protein